MLPEQDKPSQKQTFHLGINRDDSPSKVFSKDNSGMFIDAHNMQPVSTDGNTLDLEKIKGESVVYTNGRNDTGYQCMASDTVNGDLVEIWAPANPSFPGIIRVNGVIVLSSTNFAISPDYPIQFDSNESEINGEICLTDNHLVPFVFNIQDMVDSISTGKYFTAFEPKLYQVNIQSALDIPVFIDLVNVGGGGGLPVGNYQYQIRYSSAEGDRTNWSHPTPMISIPESYNSDSDQYPYIKTFGAPPNPSSLTALAPKIRFRVTNLYNYDFIEVKRIPYNKGAGIEYQSNGVIVARVDIFAGEISIREYIDPQESNVSLPLDANDESLQLAHIDTAGSVRYHDRRLVFSNITYPSKVAELEFEEVNEKHGWPVIDKLFKAGIKDPWNNTYRKSELRGETAGFGAVCYDCVGNTGYVTKIPQLKNYTFPNRRDRIADETSNYSFYGTVKAALTNDTNAVGQTHEVFDHFDAISKTNKCDFKNIIEKGRVLGLTGTKLVAPFGVIQDCDETNAEIENHGANVSALQLVDVSYQPFTPVRQSDPSVTGHNYLPDTKVSGDNVNIGPFPVEAGANVHDYHPKIFGPAYFAMGMMVAGIDNFPEWAKAFAIVRTESAKRVVAQGLAFYELSKAEYNLVGNSGLGGKSSNKFWFYAPDIENGMVSSEMVNDIIANPQNYKLQFVSPLGFASEWYSAEDNLFAGDRDRCIDMIAYVRMLNDIQGPGPAEINPGEDPDMGIDGSAGDGRRYVAYDKWRNLTVIPNTFSGDPNGGNRLVDISFIQRKAEGRGTYLEIETNGDIYATVNTGGNPNFDDGGTKNLHEPMYIVNIVRTGAQVNDNDLEKYRQTTHYQKIESIIGKSNGLANQAFPLVDERWEDCVPAPKISYYGNGTQRYVYVKLVDGAVQKWVNVTFMTNVQVSNITAAMAAGTSDISGLYTHYNVLDQDRFFEIRFDQSGYIPPEGALILVRYDKTAPIRVYGGDAFIGETIFAPIDRKASAIDSAEDQFPFGVGFPYCDFKINPRYYTIRKAGAALNAVQDKEWFTLGYIRQLCAMFTVEARTPIHLAYNNAEAPNQFFPLINYVIRPNRWDPDKSYEDNHIFSDYRDDYTDAEKDIWEWGGFRFLQQINSDYGVQPPIAFFSRPQIGFTEQLAFPTREMWSLPRAINVQNSPSIKTFPANNSFDLDDNQGQIVYSWVNTTGAGENLYAITERGICMLLTKKSILSDLGANQLGFISQDSFIGGQYWLSRDIGVPDKMWRGICEATIPIKNEDSKRALFFTNKLSVYRFIDNKIQNISGGYYSKLYNECITLIQSGLTTKMTSVFDQKKRQLYLHFNGPGLTNTLVFGNDTGLWYGTNSFTFDKFTSSNGRMYGHRDMQTFELNIGYEINGDPITSYVYAGFAPEDSLDKEYLRIRINSNRKPVQVDFYKVVNSALIYQCRLNASNGPYYLKNFRGWENNIPRIETSVDAARPRLQDTLVVCRIFHNLAESFTIRDVEVQYKKII